MKQSDDLFESLNWSAFRLLPDLTQEKPNAAVLKFLFFILLILLFVGDEAVKLIFRKGFGTSGVHWWKVLLCIGCFGGLGWTALEIGMDEYSEIPPMFSRFSFYIAGGFNIGLAIFLFYKGFIQRRNKLAHKYYRGDSTLLAFLMGKGWSQAKVQNLAEPLTILGVGAMLTVLNPFLGLPLAFCAISSWFTYAADSFAGFSHVRDTLAIHGHQSNKTEDFSTFNN